MKKTIFTYWVTIEDGVPEYLKLCVETWAANIPDVEVVTINPANINQYADGKIDLDKFLLLKPMFQSDIASWVVLNKCGGIFMDLDTIVTKNIFEELEKFDDDKLVMFGYKGTFNAHVAVMAVKQPNNPFVSAGAELALKRFAETNIKLVEENGVMENYGFNVTDFGSDIITTIGKDENLRKHIEILDRTETGNILESCFEPQDGNVNPLEQYVKFYFTKEQSDRIPLEELLGKIKFGAVSLHNSCTPDWYKKGTYEEVMGTQTLILSRLLKYALRENG